MNEQQLKARIAILEKMDRSDLLAEARKKLADLLGEPIPIDETVNPSPLEPEPPIVHSSLADFCEYLRTTGQEVVGPLEWRRHPNDPTRLIPWMPIRKRAHTMGNHPVF